ncbi:uncharacterized protein IL334_002755 [Kwoniella shivajii]|uniref:AGC-kinase C-terminal domain-containing protein n=1 Tax=Kwoniella shivajii TaxID=564305 RepID=A0ABZ1CW02_9TREE|nr:hypothetical protein IL334_002755 [Kwoniella shivajii]
MLSFYRKPETIRNSVASSNNHQAEPGARNAPSISDSTPGTQEPKMGDEGFDWENALSKLPTFEASAERTVDPYLAENQNTSATDFSISLQDTNRTFDSTNSVTAAPWDLDDQELLMEDEHFDWDKHFAHLAGEFTFEPLS